MQIDLNELEPETMYSMALQGQNIAGLAPTTAPINFKTLPIGKIKQNR